MYYKSSLHDYDLKYKCLTPNVSEYRLSKYRPYKFMNNEDYMLYLKYQIEVDANLMLS